MGPNDILILSASPLVLSKVEGRHYLSLNFRKGWKADVGVSEPSRN